MINTTTESYQQDWNDEKNDLTWALLNAGCTIDDYPAYVEWIDRLYQFEYTMQFLNKSVWEAPCGLMKNGIHLYSHMGYAGICWCPENNNPVFICPLDDAGCQLNDERLRDMRVCGDVYCAFHLSNKPYCRDNSVEKLVEEKEAYKNMLKNEFYKKLKWYDGQLSCQCIRWDNDNKKWYASYDPGICAIEGCYNDTCILTGKTIAGKKGNVFYDVKITRIRRDGTFWDGQPIIQIVKGKKVFRSPRPLAICEAYAKTKQPAILDSEIAEMKSKLCLNNDTKIEVLNVRAEIRETRDLIQDLHDAQEGIKILHASDIAKAKAEKKAASREKRIKAKKNRLELETKKVKQITLWEVGE